MRSGFLPKAVMGAAVFVSFLAVGGTQSTSADRILASGVRIRSSVTEHPVVSTTTSPTTTSATPINEPTNQPSPTQSTLPAPPPVVASAPSTTIPVSSSIQVLGSHLVSNGSTYHFTGINAYEAATDYGTNAGCGSQLTDSQLNQLFASLPPNSMVRIAALQGSMATNINTHELDWGPLQRVFNAATAHGQRLIVTIANQGGTCDNMHWEDLSWYEGGFMNVFNDPQTTQGTGLTPLSYWTYLQDLVNEFKSSPALGMWEPMSEPNAGTCPLQDEPLNCASNQTCPDEAAAATALRYFFDTVGGEIHALDPSHPVESGMLGSGQCGTSGGDYEYVSASPGIDVLSYHDYYGTPLLGGDQWNGIGVRLQQAAALNKPIIAGEMGILAGTTQGCLTPAARNAIFQAKERAQIQAGVSGVLAWNWVPSAQTNCSYDVDPTDPMLQAGGALEG